MSAIEILELIGYIVGIPLGIPIVIFVLGFVFGFIWSPFAALSSGIIAHRHGRNFFAYAVVGGFYSLLFFLPWVYLTVRMYGKSFPRIVVIVCYWLLFFIWAALTFGYIAFGIGTGSHYPNALGLSILANIVLWVYSLWNLRRRRAAQNRERQADDSAAQGITRPPISSVEMPGAYLMPILCLYLSIWLFMFLWILEFQYT